MFVVLNKTENARVDNNHIDTQLPIDDQPTTEKVKKVKKEKVPYPVWCLLGGDDDEDDDLSLEKLKQYAPMGLKQGAVLAGAYAITFIASAFFFAAPTNGSSMTPMIVQEFAGSGMDMAKKAMIFIPEELQNYARFCAYIGLPLTSFVLPRSFQEGSTPQHILQSIPLIYPSMGVLRYDFNKYLNLTRIEKYGKQLEPVDATIKLVASGALFYSMMTLAQTSPNAVLGFLAAAGAIIYKGESRRIVDFVEKQIVGQEGIKRKLFLTAFFGALAAMTATGASLLGSNSPLTALLLTPPTDTLIRTGKSALKKWQKARNKKKEEGEEKVESTCAKYFKNIGQGAALLTGLSALGGIVALAQKANVGFATTLLVDLVSTVKIFSKEMPAFVTWVDSALLITAAAIFYGFQEFSGKGSKNEMVLWAYMATLGIATVAYGTAMYQARKHVTPPKVKKLEKAAKKAAALKKPVTV